MKTLILMTILTLSIACEQKAGSSETQAQKSDIPESVALDITSDFDGNYNTACIPDSDLEFGAGRIQRIELNSGTPIMIITEYGEASCMTPVARRTYNLAYSVESYEVELEEIIEANIEFIQSSIEILHVAYDGYNACGFVADKDVEYVLNNPCTPNLDGLSETYRVEVSGSNYKFTGSTQVLDFVQE